MITIKLHNSDCLEALKTMDDKQYDLAIIDPPYGIGEDGSKAKHRGNWRKGKEIKSKSYKTFSGNDKEPPTKEYFDLLFEKTSNQILWGANHYMDLINKRSSCWLVWDKKNTGDFADCELAYTSFKTAVRKFEFMWNGMLRQDKVREGDRIHPTQKPVALYKWILTNYAKENNTILDTHFGSLSSGIACVDLNYNLTAYELNEHYFGLGVERLLKHCKQGDMYREPVLVEVYDKDNKLTEYKF